MENSPPGIQTMPDGAGVGGLAEFTTVGPNADLESVAAGGVAGALAEAVGAAGAGSGALAEATGAGGDVALAVVAGLRRTIHAIATTSSSASAAIIARRALPPRELGGGTGGCFFCGREVAILFLCSPILEQCEDNRG